MALTINEACFGCGACAGVCPAEAISEAGDLFVIHPSRCTECVGSAPYPRCVDLCPADAFDLWRDPETGESETRSALLKKHEQLLGPLPEKLGKGWTPDQA